MKNTLQKSLILLPLLLVAGITFAAYSFTGPTVAPTSNNTDGPLNDSATDQVKTGGLSVNTFDAASNAYFNQNAIFTGSIFGGTPNNGTAPVNFGNPADTANPVNVSIAGTDTVVGTYQSDTLKTGGGIKPVCADQDGEFYICGTTPANNTTSANRIWLTETLDASGNYEVGAQISQPVSQAIEVYITEAGQSSSATSFLDRLKDAFTADARFSGVCYPPSSPTSLGAVEIYANTLKSWNTIPLGSSCTPSDVTVSISSISPDTVDGQKIQY